MAKAFAKKTRCDYCPNPATTWKTRRTQLYPSGRMVNANAAACERHVSCAAFVSMPGEVNR